MKNESTISVIVPVYNVEKYLEQCIQSIVNQSYSDLEIILVDDGSTDGSAKICDKWHEKDNRIITIHQENSGLSNARNLGIKASHGKYIGFVDSDDFINIRMYEHLLHSLLETDAQVAICREKAFFDEVKIESMPEYHIECVDGNENLLAHFMDKFTGPTTWAWNKLYRRDVIGDNCFPPNKKMEDIIFCTDVFKDVERCVWISESLYYYRQRPGSIMNSDDEGVLLNYSEALCHELKQFKDKHYEGFREKHICYCLNKIAALEADAYFQKKYETQEKIRNMFLHSYNENRNEIHNISSLMKISVSKYCRPIYHFIRKIKNVHNCSK